MSTQLEIFKEAQQVLDTIKNVVDTSNVLLALATRATDKSLSGFSAITSDKLAKIQEGMVEVNRATQAFGRQNSQTSARLLTLTLMSQGPYRHLHQCLAQIEQKRAAIRDSQFKFRRSLLKLREIKNTIEAQSHLNSMLVTGVGDEIAIDMLKIDAEEQICKITDSQLYIEGALKELAIYQKAYEEIRSAHNIPEKWDESDFEKEEITHMLRHGLLMAYREMVSTGTIAVSTLEFLEQLGVHPIVTKMEILQSLQQPVAQMSKDGKGQPSITDHYEWLDKLVDKFKSEHAHVLKRIGLSSTADKDVMYLSDKT